jgi:hypothetical protein
LINFHKRTSFGEVFVLKRVIWICMALAAPAYIGEAVAQTVIINEFMADNESTLADEDGEYSDWIELYNGAGSNVDLKGWCLTDDDEDLTAWEFPSTNIAPGGYLLVFASGKDRAVAGSELHTDFKLGASGEHLALVGPGGVDVVSEYAPEYPEQLPDVSYGFAALQPTTTWIDVDASFSYIVPSDDALGSNWTMHTGFDDATWSSGTLGVGYATDSDTNYLDLINTDISNELYQVHPTVYLRIPFAVADASLYAGLQLWMKYDDGFFAYINGEEVGRRYAPSSAVWNASATNYHPDEQAVLYEVLNLPDGDDLLISGTNILAVQAMNNTIGSSDMLMVPRLLGINASAEPTDALRYFMVPTPGCANGSGSEDLGPVIRGVTNAPAQPSAGQDILVTARVEDEVEGVGSVELVYRVMYSNEVRLAMLDDGVQDDGLAGNSVYGASIPSSVFTTGEMVRFYVSAVDNGGNTSRWPLVEDAAQYLGTVVQDSTLTNGLPVFHWFVEHPDWHREPWGNNRDFEPGSAFYEGQFYDNVQIRVRGGTAAGWTNPPLKVEFNEGHYFNYASNRPPAEEINLNSHHGDKSFLRQQLSFETYRAAGVPYCETFPVRLQKNGAFYSVAVFVEQVDQRYVERFGYSSDGAMYKMYNLMTNATIGVKKRLREEEGNADLEALVRAVSWTNTAEARVRYAFDHLDIPEMISYLAATAVIHDRDCFFKNYYVYRDPEGSREWAMFPWDKDLTFGRNWTNDLGVLNDQITFWDAADRGTWNRLVGALLEPANVRVREMFWRRLRTVMDEVLDEPGSTNLWYESRIDELKEVMQADVALHRAEWGTPYGEVQDFGDAIRIVTNDYLVPRRYHLYVTNHVDNGGDVPAAQTNSPTLHFGEIEFSPSSGNQDEEYIEILNTNVFAVDISGWSLSNAVEHVFRPGTVICSRSNMYVSPNVVAFRGRAVSPKSNENRFVQGNYEGHLSAWGETIELYDQSGALVSSMAYTGAPSDVQRYLRITEIMYDPREPPPGPYEDGFFEFIEFMNISTDVLDIAGTYFGAGFTFAFTSGVTVLDPGELLVLVRNREAFASRYATNGMEIVGGYDGRLSNNGENLKLEDASSGTVLDFRYSDTWYTNTDGGGYSLTIRDPYGDHSMWGISNCWRSSVPYDGSPGWDDSDWVDMDQDGLADTWEILHFGSTNALNGGPDEDYDQDGVRNIVEFAAGTCATNKDDRFELNMRWDGGFVVEYYAREAAGVGYTRRTRTYDLDSGTQLVDGVWSPVPGHTNRPGSNVWVIFTNTSPDAVRHYRLKTGLH